MTEFSSQVEERKKVLEQEAKDKKKIEWKDPK